MHHHVSTINRFTVGSDVPAPPEAKTLPSRTSQLISSGHELPSHTATRPPPSAARHQLEVVYEPPPHTSSAVKMLILESIADPQVLML